MGCVEGYVKIKDKNDSSIHLIKVNKLHKFRDGEWNDRWVYNFHENEFGWVENGKFERHSAVFIPQIGKCFTFNHNGEVILYKEKWFLDKLKDAAVEYIDEQLINL